MSEKNKNNFHIKITQGMEHHSNRMDIYDKGEFFYDSYRQAAYAITRIVEISRLEFEERRKQKDCHNYRRNFEYHNNIVAFCADRGQGKTSAMISMSDALRNMSAEKNGRIDKEKRDFWTNAYDFIPDSSNPSSNPVLDTHFECLPIIDPTCLEKNDSILRTVISRMFQSASQKWQDSSNCSSSMYRNAGKEKQRQKEELANKFLKCFKGLDYLYKEEKKEISSYYDDLNMVAEYGDSNNFKTMFMDLVESYLQFISFSSSDPCYSDTKNTMMVILIDDADLNTKRAFSIVEEIQKYFVIPGVLILMALHVGTLARTLEQNQLEQYKTLINYSNDPTIKERCHRAMERYVEKLFPSSHRIYLPEISKVIEQDYNFVKLSYVDKDDNDIFEKYKYLANSKFKDNYEDRLFLLIYAKTGIILAKQGDYLHEFLPNNFRQLNHFLFYLNSMEDIVSSENCSGVFKDILTFYDTSSKDNLPRLSSPLNRSSAVLEHSIETTSLWLKNLNIFKNYLLDTWCPARLSSQQLRIIENIEQSPSNIKNFNTVQMIKQIINDDRNKIGNEISDIREQPISNSQYTPMSDVIWALYRLQHTINPVNHFAFIYAVKMYYTIHLHMTALQGILKWLARRGNIIDDSPFSRLFDVLGGRIFPMHYYMKKRLPFYVFNIFNIDRASFLVPFMYKCEMAKRSVGISAAMYGNLNKKQNYFVDFRTPPLIKNMDGIISTSEYQFFDFLAPMMSLYRRSSVIDILNNVGDENIESPNGSKENAGVKALYSTLNLTCNLDLQDVIYKFFFKDPYPPEYSFEGNLLLFMGICNEFDASINDKMIINIKSQLEYVFSTIDNRVIRNFIIGNKDIENLYPLSTIGLYVGDMPFWKDTHDTDDIIAIFAVPSKSKKNDSFNKSKHKDLSLKPPEKQEHKPSNVNREDSDHKNTEKNEGKNKEKAVSESMNKIGQAEKEKAEKEKNDNKE